LILNQTSMKNTFCIFIIILFFTPFISKAQNEYVIKFKSNISSQTYNHHKRELSNYNIKTFARKEKGHPYYNLIKVKTQNFDLESWQNNKDVLFAEKLPQTHFATDTLPSDPYYPFQWEMKYLELPQVWIELQDNDTNSTVAVVDSGTDFDHEDLQRVFYNIDDPINGVDDDNNGFVDDFRGWDFGEYDNNPELTSFSNHGREMTSLVAGETNNGKGIANISYNLKYLPIKITDDNGVITDPFEGVTYAIDRGIKVINCSWYQTAKSIYAESVVDYAVQNNVMIIAAAGNENSSKETYPGSDSRVLCVGGINKLETKSNVSNYGNWVDIYSPAEDIYVAFPMQNYFPKGGTSVATALTSSAFCLLKKIFPSETNIQIKNRLIQSGKSFVYKGLQGKIINLKQAIINETSTVFQIFPNPSQGDIQITIPEITQNTQLSLVLINLLGQEVHRSTHLVDSGNKTIKTTLNVKSGQYFIRVFGQKIDKSGRITLAR